MKYCRKCGAELNDSAEFCPKCGEQIESVFSEDSAQKFEAESEKNVKNEKSFEKGEDSWGKQDGKKINTKVIIGILAGIVIAAAIVLYFVIIKPYPSKLSGVYVNDDATLEVYSFSGDGTYVKSSTGIRIEGTYTAKDKHLSLNHPGSENSAISMDEYEYKVADGGLYLTNTLFQIEKFYRDDTYGEYGQKEKQYRQAMEKYNSGDFEGAEEIFTLLDGYSESKAMLNNIRLNKTAAEPDDVAHEELKESSNDSNKESESQNDTQEGTAKESETITEQNKSDTEPSASIGANTVSEDFIGSWLNVSGRAGISISKENDHYIAYEEGSYSARSGGYGEMTCYAEDNDTLHYTDGKLTEYMFDEEGNEASIVQYTDGEGWLTIHEGNYPEGDYQGVYAKEWKAGPAADQYLIINAKRDTKRASDEYVIWYSSDILLGDMDLYFLSADELKIARNEIYARHGRRFQSEDLQNRFDSCSWYRGTIAPEKFDENMLSSIEKANIKLIEQHEDTASANSNISRITSGEEIGISSTPMWVVGCKECITLRKTPDKSGTQLMRIPLYARVNYLEQASNGFYKVFYNGYTGYALAEYLDVFEPELYTGVKLQVYGCENSITLRTGPTTSHEEICQIPLGSMVDYIDQCNDFYLVNYNGQIGYALKKYLR